MLVEQNKAVVRETAERLFNQGDLSAVDELIAVDAVDHCEPEGTDCRQHFLQVVTMLRGAFPDLHMKIVSMVAEGDQVAVHLRMSGTHQGPFMGIAPSGNRFSTDQMRIMRFRDGQMTDSWSVIDHLGWRQQLGAAPVQARPVPA
ncbi:MAG TPA: ester cyclase [Nitrolancea sp.]